MRQADQSEAVSVPGLSAAAAASMVCVNRVRVLFLIDEMESLTAGGTERQVLQMIRLLEGSEFDPDLALLRGTAWLTRQDARCDVYHSHIKKIFTPRGVAELFSLARRLRRNRYGILQTFFVEANLLGPVLGKLAGVPVVIGSRRNSNYWMSKGYATAQRWMNRLTTRLQANSEAVKQVVARQEGVSPGKIDVLYNSIDTDHFRREESDRAQIRALLGVDPSDVIVSNVSALRHPKGMETFVRAGLLVAQHATHVMFVLIGDGPLRADLETLVRSHAGTARIHFAGAQVDVDRWLSASDIGVLSSESEGFSNSILEYMAAELPVIATDVGGNAEGLGGNGILIAPRDPQVLASAVLRLVTDPELRQQLGSAARRRAEEVFSIARVRENLRNYYRGLLRTAGVDPGSAA